MNNVEVTITDNAIENLEAIKREITPALQRHPVPQSDPRTKGLIIQFRKDTAIHSFSGLPVLYDFIQRRLTDNSAEYILAVNQTPPTSHLDFLMRPHIDRRWHNSEFNSDAPLTTTVMFLDFPSGAEGGELVVFEEDDDELMKRLDAMERKDARRQLTRYNATIISPQPGRICTFPGHRPHAVLGYSAHENEIWRLSLVFAEFS